jgi:integrase
MKPYPLPSGENLFPLFEKFLFDSKNGNRLRCNLRKASANTIKNHKILFELLKEFSRRKEVILMVRLEACVQSDLLRLEDFYWRSFYFEFLNFLYEEKRHYDNYVGSLIKILKSFFNYLKYECGYSIGDFYKSFVVPKDNIQVVALTPDQYRFLAYSSRFSASLNPRLRVVKDIFVFGATLGLRISDVISLTKADFFRTEKGLFLRKEHRKTGTVVLINVPEHCQKIYLKYAKDLKVFPSFCLSLFNRDIKRLFELAGWTHLVPKIRTKRGKPVPVLKDPIRGTHFRFCDLVSSHTMRRSAVTILLSMGMKEHVVRQISGHSQSSLAFQRYIAYSEALMSREMEKVHARIRKKQF